MSESTIVVMQQEGETTSQMINVEQEFQSSMNECSITN
jgi:hypothetical protein